METRKILTMKLMLITGIFLSILGCATQAVISHEKTLDQALMEAAYIIDERIPKGKKIAMINFNSPSEQFSEYVLDELSANLVDSRKLTIIDRQDIDLRRKELDFQFSGEVDDNSMQSLGKTLGAEVIVTGSLREIGKMYRLMIRVLNVENGAVEAQYRADIVNDSRVASLLSNSASSNRTASTTSNTVSATPSANIIVDAKTEHVQLIHNNLHSGLYSDGKFQGAMNLMDAVDWIKLNAKNGGNYIIVLDKNERASGINFSFNNIKVNITLKGIGSELTVRYDITRPSVSLITVGIGVTFTLEDGIALVGLERESKPMVSISEGTFVMNGGSIRDNISVEGAGVYISNGEFIMNNGTISGNHTIHGKDGGGIFMSDGKLTMNGGIISGNLTYYGNGGGIAVMNGTFIMNGGTISGNSARGGYGGGVYVRGSGTIQKSGTAGIIYGSNADEGQANKANEGGHAVFIRGNITSKRNTTARVSQMLDSRQRGAAGGWE